MRSLFSPQISNKNHLSFKVHPWKISFSQFVYFLFFVSFLTPAGINTGILHYIFFIVKYSVCLLLIIKIGLIPIINNKFTIAILVYYALIMASAFAVHEDYKNSFSFFASNVLLLLIFSNRFAKNDVVFFDTLRFYFKCILCINCLVRIYSLIAGAYSLKFIASENHQGIFYIFAILIWLVNKYVYKRKDYFLLLLITVNVLLYSGTTMKIVFLLFICYLFLTTIHYRLKISPLFLFVLSAVIFITIVLVYAQHQRIPSDGVTFTGRTYLWQYVLEVYNDRPVWGLGYGTSLLNFVPAALISPWRTDYLGTHNDLLYRLIMGGPFAFLIFILALFLLALFLQKRNDTTREGFGIILFIMFLQSLFDNAEYELYFLMLPIIYYSICNKEKKRSYGIR